MAINPASASLRLVAKSSPQFVVDTLAELQGIVDGDPATYEGKYVVALDQPEGQALYLVESGQVMPAHDQAGYKFEPDRDRPTYYNGDGTQEAGRVGVMWFEGETNANGQLTVHATVDGLSTGAALFASIKSIAADVVGIPGNIPDRPWVAGHTLTSGKTIVIQVLRGALAVLGLETVRVAPDRPVRVRVEGVLA